MGLRALIALDLSKDLQYTGLSVKSVVRHSRRAWMTWHSCYRDLVETRDTAARLAGVAITIPGLQRTLSSCRFRCSW
jgi:hypothetical protein